MADNRVISKFETLLPSEDYKLLRAEGIKHIEKLASKLWTDYNTHDPGITILELLCYAITELGYRSSYLIEDILASDPSSQKTESKQFFTAAEILPCNSVTINDFRKLIIDVGGIKNAWLKKAEVKAQNFYFDQNKKELTYIDTTPEERVKLNGLYTILIDFEKDNLTEEQKETFKRNTLIVLNENRNLCEDFLAIEEIVHEEISVCAEIELDKNADVNNVLAKIYFLLGEYFMPSINFYSLDELLKKGKKADEIFEGPLLDHGFIDPGEFEKTELRTELRVSDIINLIMDINEVVAVKNFSLSSSINGKPINTNEKWILQLTGNDHAAVLDIGKSKIIFYKDILPYIANSEEVENKLKEMREFNKRYKLKLKELEQNADDQTRELRDFNIPEGEFMNIEDYYPVQNEFPLCFGIGVEGLGKSASPERIAKAKQLKGYLLFFEQILANFFSQLANVKHLFSFDDCVDKTYFSQVLSMIPGIEELQADNGMKLLNISDIQNLSESSALFETRRNKFLNHLMGRFCEEINEYGMLLYTLLKNGTDKELIRNKIALLNDYPGISTDRGKAFNYMLKPEGLNPLNISGMQRRIYRLLGFRSAKHILIEEENEKYFIKLYDPEDKHSFLLKSDSYSDMKTAEANLNIMMCNGSEGKNYVTVKDNQGQFYFKIMKDSTNEITRSGLFNSVQDLEKQKNKVKEFFLNRVKIESTPVVEFSNNLINIEETEDTENGEHVKKYGIVVYNPKDPSEILLKGKKYNDKECAESILHYFLSHGDNIENYRPNDNEENYSFDFLNDCSEVIAKSPKYKNALEREVKLNEVLLFFRNQCDLEGFHLIEHILFRPKSGEKRRYQFESYRIKSKSKKHEQQWRFKLKDDKGKTIIMSENYVHLHDCRAAVELIKNIFIEGKEIEILRSKRYGYHFNIVAANNEIIGKGNYWKTEEDVSKVLRGLKRYFKEEKAAEEARTGNIVDDPYSFRVSVILPSWPEKFRDINFRRFVEKTIRMETPAHIYPRICWVDLLQMKKFESIYRIWLKELSRNKPDENIVNEMIETLFSLKNVYPVVILHDCKDSEGEEPQVVLGYSALGII